MTCAVGLTKNRLALRECLPVVAVFGTLHAHGFDKIRRRSSQRHAIERLRQTRLEREDGRACVERDLKCLHRLRGVRDLARDVQSGTALRFPPGRRASSLRVRDAQRRAFQPANSSSQVRLSKRQTIGHAARRMADSRRLQKCRSGARKRRASLAGNLMRRFIDHALLIVAGCEKLLIRKRREHRNHSHAD